MKRLFLEMYYARLICSLLLCGSFYLVSKVKQMTVSSAHSKCLRNGEYFTVVGYQLCKK